MQHDMHLDLGTIDFGRVPQAGSSAPRYPEIDRGGGVFITGEFNIAETYGQTAVGGNPAGARAGRMLGNPLWLVAQSVPDINGDMLAISSGSGATSSFGVASRFVDLDGGVRGSYSIMLAEQVRLDEALHPNNAPVSAVPIPDLRRNFAFVTGLPGEGSYLNGPILTGIYQGTAAVGISQGAIRFYVTREPAHHFVAVPG